MVLLEAVLCVSLYLLAYPPSLDAHYIGLLRSSLRAPAIRGKCRSIKSTEYTPPHHACSGMDLTDAMVAKGYVFPDALVSDKGRNQGNFSIQF